MLVKRHLLKSAFCHHSEFSLFYNENVIYIQINNNQNKITSLIKISPFGLYISKPFNLHHLILIL